MFFRFLISASDRGKPLQKDKNARKQQCFQAFWCLPPLRILATLWTHHSEKHRLENTVCYPLVGEGAKVFLGQGSEKPLALVQARVCTGARVFGWCNGRPWLRESEIPCAPSPNQFWEYPHVLRNEIGTWMGKERKPKDIKKSSGTPPGLCLVCPVDMSHLSRYLSRLSRGHSGPWMWIST